MKARTSGLRRWLKSSARHLMATGVGVLSKEKMPETRSTVRILTYHRIANDPWDPFAVPPREFALQMETVALTRTTASLEEALEDLRQGKEGKPRLVLTFDDGTGDFLTEALPRLRLLALPATLYVSPARVGAEGYLGWEDLRYIRGAGIEIGSHGLDHRSLGRIPLEEVRHQVRESRAVLKQCLSTEVSSLAYPYGTLRDFSVNVKAEVSRAGYRNACTSINGLNCSSTDFFELRRTKIEQGDGPIFNRILSGCLDPWAYIDRHLSLFQNRYGR